jgi:hypothetical protein
MKGNRFLAVLFTAAFLLIFSVEAAARASEGEIRRGEIIERLVCLSDPSQSYALYLPSSYTPDRKWPVIYCFDPVARGRVPVEQFKKAAEKYGFILAGSNNSQNGPGEPISQVVRIVSFEHSSPLCFIQSIRLRPSESDLVE